MAIPEELANLDRDQKDLRLKLTALQVKVGDLKASLGRLVADEQVTKKESLRFYQEWDWIRKATVVDLQLWIDAGDRYLDSKDRLMKQQEKRAACERGMRDVNDEILIVETKFKKVAAARAEWGQVLFFGVSKGG